MNPLRALRLRGEEQGFFRSHLEQWDRQFARQAEWTRATRSHLYRRANLLRAGRVLDVGCGTGIVTEEVAARTRGEVTGLDADPALVAYAQARAGRRAAYRQGDAHRLPFRANRFDVTLCHFLLMWCREPHRAAREMVRVTRPGGAVLVCAEPDYGGRIDYPDLPLGRWQQEALRREGADPRLGRKLRSLFRLPGVEAVSVGLIPGLWDEEALRAQGEAEWGVWEPALRPVASPQEIARVRAADRAAIEAGERLVFVPIFYALVRVC